MARNGLFDDVDAALTWHPGTVNKISTESCLATCQVYFKFKGRSSHAGASPHLGRSALDAVELTNVGANYLREHLIPEARLHYAITNTGGISPNVVQAEAEVLYKMRVPEAAQLCGYLRAGVQHCARGRSDDRYGAGHPVRFRLLRNHPEPDAGEADAREIRAAWRTRIRRR
ncbi:hypothetical protein LJK88_28370 [Paenibacillus sp. P26]|nr:hypothetical protein LJK88_28370 [Paenibacillus sp. P26]